MLVVAVKGSDGRRLWLLAVVLWRFVAAGDGKFSVLSFIFLVVSLPFSNLLLAVDDEGGW